ncbi:hypothetical protein JCM19239_1749 [Vibrio variabilis]|uniref:Uncharacterized protein n=1 Tax=Vibrio variabilis TaxID=990271 RepID=A0ABQ0JN94_9VIBR|nr:hypothetical protein JCM19239_1749 [Vibrio variabilis]
MGGVYGGMYTSILLNIPGTAHLQRQQWMATLWLNKVKLDERLV